MMWPTLFENDVRKHTMWSEVFQRDQTAAEFQPYIHLSLCLERIPMVSRHWVHRCRKETILRKSRRSSRTRVHTHMWTTVRNSTNESAQKSDRAGTMQLAEPRCPPFERRADPRMYAYRMTLCNSTNQKSYQRQETCNWREKGLGNRWRRTMCIYDTYHRIIISGQACSTLRNPTNKRSYQRQQTAIWVAGVGRGGSMHMTNGVMWLCDISHRIILSGWKGIAHNDCAFTYLVQPSRHLELEPSASIVEIFCMCSDG